jgi:hypothetical protein
MSDFLETLKTGMQEAKLKFDTAQKKFVATQAEFQAVQKRMTEDQAAYAAAAQEFQSYQTLVNLHTHKEQNANTIVASTAPTALATQSGKVIPNVAVSMSGGSSSRTTDNGRSTEGNKTEAVRDLLRQHPAGMTPGEIWTHLETQLSNRTYLYSVLKRLRDRGDARAKRGKYFLNPKIAEDQNQGLVQ